MNSADMLDVCLYNKDKPPKLVRLVILVHCMTVNTLKKDKHCRKIVSYWHFILKKISDKIFYTKNGKEMCLTLIQVTVYWLFM